MASSDCKMESKMENSKKWMEKEILYQKSFDDIKVDYESSTTLSITVLCGRNISVNFLHDMVDIPDPQVYLNCETAVGNKKFKTRIARDQPNPEWNETFIFILNETADRHVVKIEAYDEDRYMFDPFLGSSDVDVTDYKMDEPKKGTLDFGKHGQIDILILKQRRTSPDIRLSLSLCQDEREFRIKRKPKTMEALQKFLGQQSGPSSLEETPTIGVAITGGGYRALATSCGAMEALQESKLFDTSMYIAGLSGSSWYIASAYARKTLKDMRTSIEHHEWVRSKMKHSLTNYLFDLSFHKRYRKYSNYKKSHNQPTTFVDFYGMVLGETLLGKELVDVRLSSLQEYVTIGDVPFPILACAHVRDHLEMNQFWEQVEMTPFEVSVPCYGMNMPTDKFNSTWGNGILQQDLPEPPLHYMMGTSGSAFAIAWSSVWKKSEINNDLWEYIDKLQQKTKRKEGKNGDPNESSSESEEEPSPKVTPKKQKADEDAGEKNFASNDDDYWLNKLEEKAEKNKETAEIDPEEGMSQRGVILKRTAKVKNCAYASQRLTKFCMNTVRFDQKASERKKLQMSTKKHHISLCDAALGCNLPSIHLLRPQRTLDVLIVVDCSNYVQEDMLMMELFATVQKQVRDHSVKFPRISLTEIAKDPFREFYIFEDEEDDECPIVLWFTLSNAKYRNLESVTPRPGSTETGSSKEKFNDFSIFPESSDFGTLRTSLSPLNFDRLRELTKFNIMTNMEIVKEKIAEKVKKMRQRNSE